MFKIMKNISSKQRGQRLKGFAINERSSIDRYFYYTVTQRSLQMPFSINR